MPLVRRIESCGSRSGKTLKPIVVADCGELPSQRQILAKRKAEIEENASLRKDPIQVRSVRTWAGAGRILRQNTHAWCAVVSRTWQSRRHMWPPVRRDECLLSATPCPAGHAAVPADVQRLAAQPGRGLAAAHAHAAWGAG